MKKNYKFFFTKYKKLFNNKLINLFVKLINFTRTNKTKKNQNNHLNNFFYTGLCSLVLILFFFFTPIITVTYKNLVENKKEVKNKSKIYFQKTLSGQSIEEDEEDFDLNNRNDIFEDVFEFENVPTDVVRLNALTIEQLFKDTNYSLEDVRRNKLVKPINLSLLPNEMGMIENIKRRKNLFIKIILPLILEENNQIKHDRIKLFSILNKNNNSKAEIRWLYMKFKQYGVKNKDLLTLKIRMDEIPTSLAIAQAAKETGWGTSRFALEGNALFGQWTFSGEGIKPKSIDKDKSHKVMRFQILQASIRAYQRNINTHSSYRKFRKLRAEARDNDEELDSLILADSLDQYAATGKEYTKILKKIIIQNSLKDFDKVKLLPTSRKLKNLI